jgi:hypothetical protein
VSLQDIYADLQAAIDQGRIDLTAATVEGLGTTLTALGITGPDALRVTNPVLTLGTDAVTLTGLASQYRAFDWNAALVGTFAGGENHFDLTLRGNDSSEAWRFSTSFQLPQTRKSTAGQAGVALEPSVLLPLVVQQPVLAVTADGPKAEQDRAIASFEGWLPLADTELQPYVQWLLTSRLRLGGQIDFTPPAAYTAPRIDVWGAAPGVTLPLPVLTSSEVGVKLLTDQPDTGRLDTDPRLMSAAALYARIQIGQRAPLRAEVTAPLLQGDDAWALGVIFDPPRTASNTLALILELLGGDPALLDFPLADGLLNSFGIAGLNAVVRPPVPAGAVPELITAGVDLVATQSALSWIPTIPFLNLKVTGLGAGWTYHFAGSNSFVTGNILGQVTFAGVTMNLSASIPQLEIIGEIDNLNLPLLTVFTQILGGGSGGDPLPTGLIVENVRVEAAPKLQTYAAHLLVKSSWRVPVRAVVFSLESISAMIRTTPGRLSGRVTGFASIGTTTEGTDGPKAKFLVDAAYDGKGVWNFQGGLAEGSLNVLEFVTGLLGRAPAVDGLPVQILLTELWLTYQTSGGSTPQNPYSARGTLVARWPATLLNQTLSLTAKAKIARRKAETQADLALLAAAPHLGDGEMVYEGEVYGTFRVNQLAVTAGLSFVGNTTTYLFEVGWGRLTLRAVTLWVADRKPTKELVEGGPNAAGDLVGDGPEGHHQAIAISLRGMTLGEVVEELVNLANPNQNYQLTAPWTVLNAIDLSRLQLVVDPTNQTIALSYEVKLELVFMSIKKVGLVYDRSAATPGVRFQLEGKLLDKEYNSDNQLTWDAVNDSPPDVAGKGSGLFDLSYLGVGQHVSLTNLTTYTSVKEVLRVLRAEMQPVKDPTKDPIAQSQLRFDESSQWMLGFDAKIMDTVAVAAIMHDPDLYGLVVGLSGKKAQALDGLEFELLYRKVTDTVGVFRTRLQVPTAFREIELGAVTITLGVITLDIFTNGNFMIDLGFPHNRNFDDSFGLQAGQFVGSGGLYFGLLDGATSTRAPRITNGTFTPVLELGVGIDAGVGRKFNKGPLKAELSLQAMGIFEGVLGWFHPTDASQPTDLYWSARGTAGIVGKLYGSVDFTIIKVSVTVEAHALVTVTLAAYRAALVELDVGVSVSAKVKVLFVTISFSFELRLQTSFTIGSDERTPWALDTGQTARDQLRLLRDSSVPRRRGAARMAELTMLLEAPREQYTLNWDASVKVFPDTQQHPLTVKLLPAFTIDQMPVQWPGKTVTATSDSYRVVVMAMVDNGVAADAESIATAREHSTVASATAVGDTDTSFNTAIEGILRWALSAHGQGPASGSVTAAQLHDLAQQLDMPQTLSEGFVMTKLAQFLQTNLPVQVSGIPTGNPGGSGGTAFPVPPPLGIGWSIPPAPPPTASSRRFAAYQQVDSTYEGELANYFSKLDPAVPGTAATRDTTTNGDDSESLATFVFRDYFLMLAKAAVQAAIATLERFPYVVTGDQNESLKSICDLFAPSRLPYTVHEGDGVDQVADYFGLSATEAIYLNPDLSIVLKNAHAGDDITVAVGATPESIAAVNPRWCLLASTTNVAIGDLVRQVAAGESLANIAGNLGSDVDNWLQTPDLLKQQDLLNPGAQLTISGGAFVNTGFGFAYAAAELYVRLELPDESALLGPDGVPLVVWYAETIATANSVLDGHALPNPLTVPTGYDATTTTPVATQPGDTVARVATSLALSQNTSADPGFAAWLADLIQRNPTQPRTGLITLAPTVQTTIVAGETLMTLADRVPIVLPDPDHAGSYLDRTTSFRTLVKGAAILAPLVPVTVPGCQVPTLANQSIGSFAALYGLAPEDAGARLATQTGLLATNPKATLTVPHPGAAPVGASQPTAADLVPAVLRAHGSAVAGQVSHFLLHGLRPPAPVYSNTDHRYHATGTPTGLFELIGQQLAGPPPAAEGTDPTTTEMSVLIEVCDPDPSHPWVSLFSSTALTGDEDHEPLAALNPGLRHRESTAGIVALTAPVDALMLTITAADLAYPKATLVPDFIANPAPLALGRDVSVHHPLQQRLLWQTTETVTLPPGDTPKLGMPTLWPFSSELMAVATEGGGGRTFTLRASDPALGPAAPETTLERYAWATKVDLQIRRLPGLANTYELIGADTVGRQILYALWDYLAKDATRSTELHLLYQPAPTTGLPNGLASVVVNPAQTYVVATNLSTETRSGPANAVNAADPPAPDQHYASFAQTLRFLQLVWECSVVGGGGYWLRYLGSDGSGLPDSIFASDGNARLTLVSIATAQATGSVDRVIYDFNNCAVVGETVDASAVSLFATTPGETHSQASVTPGNVGFGMQLRRPNGANAPFDPVLAGRRLYSFAGYALAATAEFGNPSALPTGLPVGPQLPPEAGGVRDEKIWDLRQVVPIHDFALSHDLPDVDGLPGPLADPYAGLPEAPAGQLATASVTLTLNDLFGNSTLTTGSACTGGPLPLDMPVGYLDPVIGVGEWPATTASYQVLASGGSGAILRVTATLQTGAYLPGSRQRLAASRDMASKDLRRLSAVYYQLMQPDMKAALVSTLDVDVDTHKPIEMSVPVIPLQRFVAGACAYVAAAVQLADVELGGGSAAAATLAKVTDRCGVGYDSLAAANHSVPLEHLFVAPPEQPVDGRDLVIPTYGIFRDGGKFTDYCSTDPPVVLADGENSVLPLQPGVELQIAPTTLTVPPDPLPPAQPPTLRELADRAGVSVESLAKANAGVSKLLHVGAVFEAGGVKVKVDAAHPDVSFDDVGATFKAEGVPFTGYMVAGANADVAGVFRPGAELVVNTYRAADGDTLAENNAGSTTADLAARNIDTVDLFATGTPVYVGFDDATPLLATPLGSAAAIKGIAPEQLLRHNRAVTLVAQPSEPDESWPVVPGQAALPSAATDELRVPFTLPANATLDGVAALFVNADPSAASAALALATANEHMPATVAPNVRITIGTHHVDTGSSDSFADVVTAFGGAATLTDVVAEIEAAGGYLATGALLMCPPAQLASGGAAAFTAAAVAIRYGFTDAAAIPGANSALAGVVAPQVSLTLPPLRDDEQPVTIVSGEGDTFESLVWRFAQARRPTSVAEILASNPQAQLLLAGARLLLPPAPSVLQSTFGGTSAGWRFSGAIFPIHVWVQLARDPDRVLVPFRGEDDTGAAVVARAPIPPLPTAAGRTLALGDFATALQGAVPGLRVATGRVINEQRESSPTDVWGVTFGAGALASIGIQPAVTAPSGTKLPRYFALRPLANQLVARNQVDIKPLKDDGTLGDPAATDFQGIDMEVWARRLLSDVDVFLSAPYAAAAYEFGPTSLQAVIEAKKRLAGAVADGLDYVLDIKGQAASGGPPSPDYVSAREKLLQRLLVGLADGYTTAVVVQYDATVAQPGVSDARLSGTGRLPANPTGEQLRTTLSTAKTSLAKDTSYVNFLVGTAEEGTAGAVELPFEYGIDEVEFAIKDVVAGYQSSNWLSLVTAFDDPTPPPGVTINIGTPQVPLPLRSYPPLPALLGHGATPTNPQPTSFEDALRWDYAVRFEHRSAATDQIKLALDFNKLARVGGGNGGDTQDLFAALAQYVAVAGDLWSVLQRLPPASTADATLTNAIATFASVVDTASQRWAKHWQSLEESVGGKAMATTGAQPAPESYAYMATLVPAAAVGGVVNWGKLILTLAPDVGRPADGDVSWPYITCSGSGGKPHAMGQGVDTPEGREYLFPKDTSAIPVMAQVSYELRFAALHVARYQTATAAVQVIRNAQLVDLAPTSEPFVYQTTSLSFPSQVVPLLSWAQPFDIGEWSDTPASNPLDAVFRTVFEGDGTARSITCGIRYGFELGGSAIIPLVTQLPVKLRPRFQYDDNSTVADIVDEVIGWRQAESPATTGGEWVFSLTMFAGVPGTDRPVLDFKRLFSRTAS